MRCCGSTSIVLVRDTVSHGHRYSVVFAVSGYVFQNVNFKVPSRLSTVTAWECWSLSANSRKQNKEREIHILPLWRLSLHTKVWKYHHYLFLCAPGCFYDSTDTIRLWFVLSHKPCQIFCICLEKLTAKGWKSAESLVSCFMSTEASRKEQRTLFLQYLYNTSSGICVLVKYHSKLTAWIIYLTLLIWFILVLYKMQWLSISQKENEFYVIV